MSFPVHTRTYHHGGPRDALSLKEVLLLGEYWKDLLSESADGETLKQLVTEWPDLAVYAQS